MDTGAFGRELRESGKASHRGHRGGIGIGVGGHRGYGATTAGSEKHCREVIEGRTLLVASPLTLS